MSEFRKGGIKQLQFYPHKEADFHSIESKIQVDPINKTKVLYNPAIEPGSPEFWGMAIKAGFINFQYEQREMPAPYNYWVRKNRKPRGKQLGQSAQMSEVEQ